MDRDLDSFAKIHPLSDMCYFLTAELRCKKKSAKGITELFVPENSLIDLVPRSLISDKALELGTYVVP